MSTCLRLRAFLHSCRYPSSLVNHLDVLTRAYSGASEPEGSSTFEIQQALDSVHSKGSEYAKRLTFFYFDLEQDIDDFKSEATGSDKIYFNQFLKTVIEPDNKDKVRQLMICPVTLAVAFSYRPPGRIPEELGTVSEVEGETSGSNVSEGFERPTYSQIFHYPLPVYANPATLSEREAAASADFRIFAELFQRYLTRIDEIINHSSESGRNEHALIDNVLNEIVIPISENLMGPLRNSIRPGRAVPPGDQLVSPIAIKLNAAFLGISQFVCNLLLVDLDPDTISETKEITKRVHSSNDLLVIQKSVMQIHALDGIARETPNGRISANVVGSTRHFDGKPTGKDILSDPAKRVLFVRITLVPFELKKELCRITERSAILLANESVDNAADDRLDMNNGWSCSQIIEQDNFLEIMQQGLSYVIEGTEIFFNHVIYFFLHHGILHLAHLEIELGLLVFDDHPTERGVEVVSLEEHTRTRTVTENDHKHEEKITEKIIPVKFKAYPLETVSGAGKVTSKVPLHSGMVALIVLMQKLTPIFKSASEMKAIRVKMMAIRAAMKIGIPLNTIQKEGMRSQRGDEAENQDEYDHGSQPEGDGFKRKKAKLTGL